MIMSHNQPIIFIQMYQGKKLSEKSSFVEIDDVYHMEIQFQPIKIFFVIIGTHKYKYITSVTAFIIMCHILPLMLDNNIRVSISSDYSFQGHIPR